MTAEVVGAWMQAFFWLMAGVGSILGCAVAIKKLREPDQRTPNPLRVAPVAEVIARPEFDKHRSEVDARFAKAAESRKAIHEKTEVLANEISALRTTADTTRERIGEIRDQLTAADERHETALGKINDRIDHLPQRIAETLRTLKS